MAHLKSARATEDDGWRRFAAAKRGGTCGGEHLGPEHPVADVPEAGTDVGLPVQLAVDSRGPHGHVGMMLLHGVSIDTSTTGRSRAASTARIAEASTRA